MRVQVKVFVNPTERKLNRFLDRVDVFQVVRGQRVVYGKSLDTEPLKSVEMVNDILYIFYRILNE